MALRFFQKTETIPFADGQGEISVRGLTPAEIALLVDSHREFAERLFDRFTGRDPDSLTVADAGSVAGELLVKAPAIMAHVVALGADAADQYDLVAKLPLDVQTAALERIAEFTFALSGGFQNFLALVLRLATSAGQAAREARALRPSMTGNGA